MPRPAANLQRLRADKRGNINPSVFNFLENLLVFRTLEELSVPAESGVKFRISRQAGEPGICLLIHVDNQRFPIFDEGVARPDYFALYLHGDGCLCTIIEMKGTESRNLTHGLEQIKSLADKLKREFAEHLPSRFRLYIQGILLCPHNAQVPNPLIQRMAGEGLTILPATCNSRAELFPYISRKNELRNGFTNEPRHPTPPGPIEKMMSCDTLYKRLDNRLTQERPGTGLHINFVLSDADEYAVLMTRGRKCVFVVKEHGDEHRQRLLADIKENGLESKFDVEPMPEE